MRVIVLDHGAGNLHSLAGALESLGASVHIEPNASRACSGDALVIPGVGGFGPVATRLAPERGIVRSALADGLPCLAICLGMQLLFGRSDEGEGEGLALLRGETTRIAATRIPHMGWNRIEAADPLLPNGSLMYYAHSFAVRPADSQIVSGWTTYDGDRFASIVRTANTVGVQFHPEKSGTTGRRFLAAWLEQAEACA
ncbi:MAG TPA: imidazole glycerol phosphate synthase subunit HisH [Vicinamibacterales bacterium]|nr:imidazole glycerol phosphate synthase subunit HisH [Vicinamibacterales bacterium]